MNNPQNRLEKSEQRLATAMGRLEGALDAKAASGGNVDASLADELSRLQTENTELKTLVGQASSNLDATIAKLKQQVQG